MNNADLPSVMLAGIERLASEGKPVPLDMRSLYEAQTGRRLPTPPILLHRAAGESTSRYSVAVDTTLGAVRSVEPSSFPVKPVASIRHDRVTRSPKTKASRFVRIDNAALQDSRLSFRARGLLAHILSYVTSFVWSAERLAAVSPDGKDAIRGALRELVKFGYAELKRQTGERGNIENCWYFRESPRAINPDSASSSTGSGFVGAGQPDSGGPAPGGMGLLETTVGKTTIRETTSHAQSARVGQSVSFSVAEAKAMAGTDTPGHEEAWCRWVDYLVERSMFGRTTVYAQREAFEKLGDDALAAVANTIGARLRRLCLPKTAQRSAATVSEMPDDLKIF